MFLTQSRSLENPSTPLSSGGDDLGITTDSGERINKTRALQYSPVWRAVNLISSTVAKIPCDIYRTVKEGKERDFNHPAYNLLRWKPNDEQTAYYFFQTMMQNVLLEPGNSYAYIERDGAGRPTQLIYLEPDKVTPVRYNGKLYYIYGNYDPDQNANTRGLNRLDKTDVLHFKGMGDNGLTGFSVLAYARNSIAMGSGAQKYSNKYFANNAEPRVVLEYPEWMDQEKIEAIRGAWNSMHKGLDNIHKTAILQGGMKANTLSMSARDSQLIESLDFSIKDVANWFGVPPHKVGDSSRTAYNSLEQENQSFLDDTIDVWFVMIEQECRDKLLTEAEKENNTHAIEFNRAALVRANLIHRTTYYRAALAGHPWATVDEVRNAENMNGVGLDTIIAPSNNFGEPEETGQETSPGEEDESRSIDTDGIKEHAFNAVQDVCTRMEKRLKFNFDAKMKKRGRKHIATVRKESIAEQDAVIREALTPTVRTLCAITGTDENEALTECLEQIHQVIEDTDQ